MTQMVSHMTYIWEILVPSVELPLNLRVISVRLSPELMRIRVSTKTSSKPINKATNIVHSWDFWIEFPVLTLYLRPILARVGVVATMSTDCFLYLEMHIIDVSCIVC